MSDDKEIRDHVEYDADGETGKDLQKSNWFTRLTPRKRRNLAIGAGLAATFCLAAAATPAIWFHFNNLPDIRMLETYQPLESITIYDRYDKVAAVVSGGEDRRVVPLAQVSQDMRRAMITAEDHDFYKHGGINPSSIMRAAVVNFKAGRIVEGGSTITQQLVKNLFFPGEKRTFNRKIKEFVLANQVDGKYSKDKILEMYLNQIYFGNQSYGVESAAQRYFSKPASQLNLAESAFIAGLVKAPSYLSNPANRGAAIARQQQVLDDMVSYGIATQAEVDQAKSQHLAFRHFVSPYQKYPFYVSYVVDALHDNFGEQELQHGCKVYTNLDPVAQTLAEKALSDGIRKAPPGVSQGALVSVKVDDGGVIALVGGVGPFEKHQWNRAIAPHTMGSSFKPFVYLTGFLKGLTPDTVVNDAPFSAPSGGQSYSPKNFDGKFMGPMPIRKALALSRNVCAVRIAAFDGIKNVINTARLCGITSRLDPYLPTAVGACAASPLEMAGAYATFARGGIQITPHALRRVEDTKGKVIETFNPQPHKAFDSNSIAFLVDAMQGVVDRGTAVAAKLPGRPVAGKTGTSDKSRDVWFVGYTPDMCTATWGGSDHEHINGHNVTGGQVMAGIWQKYMKSYYDTHPTPIAYFPAPKQPSGAAIAKTLDDAVRMQKTGVLADAASNPSTDATDTTAQPQKDGVEDVASTSSNRSRKLIAKKKDAEATDETTVTPGEEATEAGETTKDETQPALPAAEAKEVKTTEKVESNGDKLEQKTDKVEKTEKSEKVEAAPEAMKPAAPAAAAAEKAAAPQTADENE